ncbi:MAG: YraN family protein [Rickettsiales bacterium]
MLNLTRHIKGILAEKIAQIFLNIKGYRILNKRYKTRFSEVDLIAYKNRTIIFIEIKYRKQFSLEFNPLSHSQLTRIRKTANIFITTHRAYVDCQIRFDVILIKFFSIRHIVNAF